MNVACLPNGLRNVEAGDDLLDARPGIGLAVAVQVVASVATYGALRRELVTAANCQDVSARLWTKPAHAQSSELGDQAQIKEQFEAILAELRVDLAYAETQTADANLYPSIGLNPNAPGVTGNESVPDLSGALGGLLARRDDVSAVAQTN